MQVCVIRHAGKQMTGVKSHVATVYITTVNLQWETIIYIALANLTMYRMIFFVQPYTLPI